MAGTKTLKAPDGQGNICPGCGKRLSTAIRRCPDCGHMMSVSNPWPWIMIIAIALGSIYMAFFAK